MFKFCGYEFDNLERHISKGGTEIMYILYEIEDERCDCGLCSGGSIELEVYGYTDTEPEAISQSIRLGCEYKEVKRLDVI